MMTRSERLPGPLRALVRVVRVMVLVSGWFGGAMLAVTAVAAGFLAGGVVIGFALLRIVGHMLMPRRMAEKATGGRWVAVWVAADAVTLLGSGLLVIGGAIIALAALSTPYLWSGIPGVLAVVSGVQAGALVSASAARWRAAHPRREAAA